MFCAENCKAAGFVGGPPFFMTSAWQMQDNLPFMDNGKLLEWLDVKASHRVHEDESTTTSAE